MFSKLDKLNSMTKYPSIFTYHKLGNKGTLQDEILRISENEDERDYRKLYVTEKINGTNVRIILLNDDFIIGSRENLLYSKGDRIINETMDIVKNVVDIASDLSKRVKVESGCVYVVYGELYGGTVGKEKKNYSNDSSKFGFRVFDIMYSYEGLTRDILNQDRKTISFWRDCGNQIFLDEYMLADFCKGYDLERVPTLAEIEYSLLPKNIEDMYKFILPYSKTIAGINEYGNSEGIVIRDFYRKYIRKIRFEEYRKTLKIK